MLTLYLLQDNSIPESEFLSSEGALYFKEDVSALNITVTALPDHLPEYDEQFTLLITNATGENTRVLRYSNRQHINESPKRTLFKG